MNTPKLRKLSEMIRSYPKVIVAFSGGVDSTLLLKLCAEFLGPKNVTAVTGISRTYTPEEKNEARRLARGMGVRHVLVETNELGCPEFAENPAGRCYFCKKELFVKIAELASEEAVPAVFDATNADDLGDYRPGRKAAEEMGVVSPFVLAGLTKEDVRAISKSAGLETWDKPANPCLASRIPYGHPITWEALDMVHQAEKFIRGLGFTVVRVRHHDKLARIEVPPADLKRLMSPKTAAAVAQHLRSLGYLWVSMDMEGYRMGSLNCSLGKPAAKAAGKPAGKAGSAKAKPRKAKPAARSTRKAAPSRRRK